MREASRRGPARRRHHRRDARRGGAPSTGRPLGLTGRDLTAVLDPRQIVATRTGAGGAAPARSSSAMVEPCRREQAAELRATGRALGAPSSTERRATRCSTRRPTTAPPTAGRTAMTDRSRSRCPTRSSVVNVGLPLFADAVARAGPRRSMQVDWRIPAGGDPDAGRRPERLYGPRAERSTRPTPRWCAGWTPGVPLLVDVAPGRRRRARRSAGRTLLHCGPAIELGRGRATRCAARCGPRWWPRAGPTTSTQADALLAAGEVAARAGQPSTAPWSRWPPRSARRRRCAWSTTPTGGTRAFAPINQGPGDVAWFGRETAGGDRPAGVPARRRRPGARARRWPRPARSTSSPWPRRASRWATTSTCAPRPRPTC